MPTFALVPARPDDLTAIASLQYSACTSDPAYRVVFPKGPSLTSLSHTVQQFEYSMENDPTFHTWIVRDGVSGETASYAIWHFYPPHSPDVVEHEMLQTEFPLPIDANKEAGNKLIHTGVRTRHEVVMKNFGIGKPYACSYSLLLVAS